MNYFIILLLGLIEQILVMIIGKELASIEYEEISVNYAVFRFKTKEIEHYGINMLIRIFFPIIFIIITSGVLYKLNLDIYVKNIYLVTAMFYIYRWIFIIAVQRRTLLHYWRREFTCFVLSMFISVWVYYGFIIQTREIFISLEALRDAIWFAIISFFVGLTWNLYKKKFSESYEKRVSIRERYIYSQFNKFKKKYNINLKNKKLNALVYAIMIYENYNRPPIIRIFEYIKCFICGHATLGIMQVTTNIWITDRESVNKGVEILKKSFYKSKKDIGKTIKKYNGGTKYSEEVEYIYNIVLNIQKNV